MAVDIIARGMAAGSVKPGSDGKIPAEYLPSYVDDITDLVAVSSTAPATCSTGDKYYNTTDKLIYTATADNTWGTTGTTPEDGKIYLDISTNPAASYRWSGTDLVEVGQDLSDYVRKTDYATDSVGGVIRTSGGYGTSTANGILIGQEKTYEQYQSANTNMFISKGTLENVITGKGISGVQFIDSSNTVPKIDELEEGIYRIGTNNVLIPGRIDVLDENGNYTTFSSLPEVFIVVNKVVSEEETITLTKGSYVLTAKKRFNGTDVLFNVNGVYEIFDDGNTVDKYGLYYTSSDYLNDSVIQLDRLPTTDVSFPLGQIVQYTGVTNQDYTNGYFYKMQSTASPDTYAWEQVNVQPNGGSSSGADKILYLGNITDFTEANPLNMNDLEDGVYLIQPNYFNSSTKTIWLTFTTPSDLVLVGKINLLDNSIDSPVKLVRDSSQGTGDTSGYLGFFEYTTGGKRVRMIINYDYYYGTSTSHIYCWTNYSYDAALTTGNQTISGVKTFNSLPESSVVPTTNNQLVNKKYVDDNAGGYSNIFSTDVNSFNNDTTTRTKVAEFITKNKGNMVFFCITSSPAASYNYSTSGAAIFKMYVNGIFSSSTYHGVKITGSPYGETYQSGTVKDVTSLEIRGTWSDNVFTLTSASVSNIEEADCYLSTSRSANFTPTLNGHPATKKYVDDNVSQVSTLPTAASTNEGRIYQYIGATDNTYTNGYFYKCVSDGASPATYSWENIDVQLNKELPIDYYLPIIKHEQTYSNATKEKLSEIITNGLRQDVSIGYRPSIFFISDGYLSLTKCNLLSSTSAVSTSITYYEFEPDVKAMPLAAVVCNARKLEVWGSWDNNIFTVSSVSDSSFILPKYLSTDNTTSYTPTANYHPATKKYVDDSEIITLYTQSGLSEYSASSTYAVGDYVYYNNLIYICNTAISVAEAWTAAHWTQKTYLEYLQDVVVAPFTQTIAQRLAALTSLPVSDLQVVNELPQNQEQGTMYFVEGE